MVPENEAINVLTVTQSKAPVLVSICIIYEHAQCCEGGMKAEAGLHLMGLAGLWGLTVKGTMP